MMLVVVGAVLGRGTDARWLIAGGLIVMAAGNYWMAMLNLDVSPTQVIWPRVVLICGLSMIFAPISVAAFKYTPPHLRAAAVGLFALLRNEGGSVGTSVAQTLVERREQFHNARVGEFLDPFNPAVRAFAEQSQAAFLQQTGDPAASQHMALHVLEGLRQQQAASLAYFDTFWLFAMLAIALLPLVFLMKPSAAEKALPSIPRRQTVRRFHSPHRRLRKPIIPVMRTVRSLPMVIVMRSRSVPVEDGSQPCRHEIHSRREVSSRASSHVASPRRARRSGRSSCVSTRGCITTGPRQWLQNGLKVGPEYGTASGTRRRRMDPGERSARPSEPPCRWRLVERLRRPHPHLPGPPRLRTKPQHPSRRRPRARSARRPGDLRRQPAAAVAASNRLLQPGQPEPEHAHHQSTGQVAAARLARCVLELVLRLQPELGARFLGPHPPEHRIIQRQPRCIGGGLRRRARNPFRRRRHELRAVPGRPAANQDRARQRPDSGGRAGPRRPRSSASARRPGSTSSRHGRSWSKRDPRSPGLQILLGQANDTLCIPGGHPAARPGGRSRARAARWAVRPIPTRPAGSPPASRPTFSPPARCPQRRAPGGRAIGADRRRRSRPLPDHLHQRHHRLGRRKLLAGLLQQELSGPAHRPASGGTS